MNALSIESSSLLTKECIFAFAAGIGGIFVLIGLWKEYKSEKSDKKQADRAWFSDINEYRDRHKKSHCGEILVMAGVFIEVIVAIVFASLDVADKYAINKQASTIDPMNRPIVSINAHIAFLQFGTNRTSIDPTSFESRGPWVRLNIFSSKEAESQAKISAVLFCSSCQVSHSDTNLIWYLDFSKDGFGVGKPIVERELTLTNALQWDTASLVALFLPRNTKTILPLSDLEIIVNGVIQKKIPLNEKVLSSWQTDGISVGKATIQSQ